MSDLAVIYDNEVDLAALVDLTSHYALGPIAPTPDGVALLQRFAHDVAPFADHMDRDDLMAAWAEWFQRVSSGTAETPATPSEGTLDGTGPADVDSAPIAQATAAESGGEPPAQQPADTDMEADTGETHQVVTCWNCNGERTVLQGDTRVQCNMCRGTGQVTVAAGVS